MGPLLIPVVLAADMRFLSRCHHLIGSLPIKLPYNSLRECGEAMITYVENQTSYTHPADFHIPQVKTSGLPILATLIRLSTLPKQHQQYMVMPGIQETRMRKALGYPLDHYT
jgi:hypothetical protein